MIYKQLPNLHVVIFLLVMWPFEVLICLVHSCSVLNLEKKIIQSVHKFVTRIARGLCGNYFQSLYYRFLIRHFVELVIQRKADLRFDAILNSAQNGLNLAFFEKFMNLGTTNPRVSI